MAPRPARTPGRALLAETRRRHRRRVVLGSSLFVSHQVGELAVPVIAGLVVDRAVATGDGGALVGWIAVLLVVFATLSTSWRLADRTISAAMEGLGHELRVGLAKRSVAPGGIADRPTTGHVVSVAGSDVQAVMGDPEASFLWAGSVAAIVAAAVVVLWASVPLGLIVVLGLPPVILVLQALTAPIERRLGLQQVEAGRAAATATDLLAGLRPLKGLRAEREASDRYRVMSRSSLAAGLRASNLLAAQQGLATVVIAVFVAIVALMGGRWATLDPGEPGRLTIGELIAAVGATQFLVGPLRRIAAAASMRAAARASADRIAAVLDAPVAVPEVGPGDGQVVPDATGAHRLELRDVRHRRLDGLDLVIGAGELVAVAGDEPAVAEDLISLLGRWSDPDAGELLLGGVPFAEWPIRELRRHLLVSPHDAVLFDGTVRAALDPRGRGAAPAGTDLDRLLAATSADEVVTVLADGLDSRIGERGLALSGGQRQRIVLARALALDPPVLVLHEPTTAVDAVTEARIAAGLRRRRGDRSTVVVTSSPALLAVADRVVFLGGGRVIASATHDDLLAMSETYRELVTR